MSNLVDYAEQELTAIGMGADTPDEYNKMMHDSIIEIVEKFADQGHSGFSANYALGILQNLMAYKPLSPLTGADDEWIACEESVVGRPGVFQNKRCFRVFKENGQAYDTEGKIFYTKEDRSDTYTNSASHTPITFPYAPVHEYVKVEEDK